MFCFSFLHYLENYGPWILLYCMLSIPKRPKEKKENFLMLWYHIKLYRYRFVSIGIVSYHKKIKGTHPYIYLDTHGLKFNFENLGFSLFSWQCKDQVRSFTLWPMTKLKDYIMSWDFTLEYNMAALQTSHTAFSLHFVLRRLHNHLLLELQDIELLQRQQTWCTDCLA